MLLPNVPPLLLTHVIPSHHSPFCPSSPLQRLPLTALCRVALPHTPSSYVHPLHGLARAGTSLGIYVLTTCALQTNVHPKGEDLLVSATEPLMSAVGIQSVSAEEILDR